MMSEQKQLRTGLIAVAAIVSLFLVDRALAKLEQTEIEREAESKYRTGLNLLAHGDSTGAAAALQRAHVLARDKDEYTLGWAEALAAAGAAGDAEARVRDVLRANSNQGKANLLLARLLAAESKADEAIAFYHRAIYGTWPRDAAGAAMAARMELAEYLGRQQRHQELLSELLLLEGSAGQDTARARKLAGLFLAAGSTSRAIQLYRDILRKEPDNEQAYEGLGEADLIAGNYRNAELMFLSALKNNPTDQRLAHRVRYAHTLATLDPTLRKLSAGEKFSRATTILEGVRKCVAAPALDEVDQMLNRRGPATNEQAEQRLALAEKLWAIRPESCHADEAIAAILQKLQRVP